MSKENNGGPAFPQDLQGRRGDDPEYQGMTLRDWFAGQAVAGLCANTRWMENIQERTGSVSNLIGTAAYEVADSLLKVRDA